MDELEELRERAREFLASARNDLRSDPSFQSGRLGHDEVALRALTKALTVSPEKLSELCVAIWRETYRHDTLLNWCEVKPGTMHHKRVVEAARAAAIALGLKVG